MRPSSELPESRPAATGADASRAPSLSLVAVSEWLGARSQHAVPRLISIIVTTVLALTFAKGTPAPWGLIVLFGAPLATIVISANAVTYLWVRRGRSIGLDDATIREIRGHLRQLPPRTPLYSGDELLAWLQDRVPRLQSL